MLCSPVGSQIVLFHLQPVVSSLIHRRKGYPFRTDLRLYHNYNGYVGQPILKIPNFGPWANASLLGGSMLAKHEDCRINP